MFRLTCLTVAVILCATAHGEPLRLSEALEHHPEIRAFSADIAAPRGEVTMAATWDNPELLVSPGARPAA